MIRRHLMPQSYTADDELQVLGSPRDTHLGPVIRCLLWNILKAKRMSWYTDFVELSADRDLVILQEAVLKAPSDPLFANSSRFEWVMARSFRNARTGVENGVKTGSVAHSTERHFYLSPHAEPVIQTQKLILTTMYELADCPEKLLVLNMHAINFVSVTKYIQQLNQLSLALEGHTGPIILGGDFNTWTPTRLQHFQKITNKARLVEAPMQRQRKLSQMNQHLDHLFYRGLKLRSVASLSHYQSSDHAPITATFEVVKGG